MAEAIAAGDRRSLARAITLIESTRDDHQRQGRALLERLLPRTGAAQRIGISGAPGVGKSTFIERFGTLLVDAGLKVAVLAVDPSSKRGGGSILGDKTRMETLARARSGAKATPTVSPRRSRVWTSTTRVLRSTAQVIRIRCRASSARFAASTLWRSKT